jgi:hypothetical protein
MANAAGATAAFLVSLLATMGLGGCAALPATAGGAGPDIEALQR